MNTVLSQEEEQKLRVLLEAFFELHKPLELSYETKVNDEGTIENLGALLYVAFGGIPEGTFARHQHDELRRLLHGYGATIEMLERNTLRDKTPIEELAPISLKRPLGRAAIRALEEATRIADEKMLKINAPANLLSPIPARQPEDLPLSPAVDPDVSTHIASATDTAPSQPVTGSASNTPAPPAPKIPEIPKITEKPKPVPSSIADHAETYLRWTKAIGPHGFADAVKKVELLQSRGGKIPDSIQIGGTTLTCTRVIEVRDNLALSGLMDKSTTVPQGELQSRLRAQRDYPDAVAARVDKIPHVRSH